VHWKVLLLVVLLVLVLVLHLQLHLLLVLLLRVLDCSVLLDGCRWVLLLVMRDVYHHRHHGHHPRGGAGGGGSIRCAQHRGEDRRVDPPCCHQMRGTRLAIQVRNHVSQRTGGVEAVVGFYIDMVLCGSHGGVGDSGGG
jgi:hypothetical protein